MPTDYSADKFLKDLVDNRLIIPAGVPGVFARGAVFEEVLERFDALVTRAARFDRAEVFTFPPVISRKVLERVHYLDSSPHLCGAVCSFFGDEKQAKLLSQRINRHEPWNDLLAMTDVMLSPAACYPLYPNLTGMAPAGGRLVTVVNWVFRHEPSSEPTRMQAFRVREYIKVGNPEEVVEWRDMWLARGKSLLESLALPVQVNSASDAFFGRAGEMLAESQKQLLLKLEVSVPIISLRNPTAVCSFNLHQDHFSSPFDIRTYDGELANTACIGFGLERVVMALLKTHGFDPVLWPATVRRLLWADDEDDLLS